MNPLHLNHARRAGSAEQVTVAQLTAEFLQSGEMQWGLDAFGHDAQTEGVPEAHDRLDDAAVIGVDTQAIDERAIVDALLAQLAQYPSSDPAVTHQHRSGDLQMQGIRINTRLGQRVGHFVVEATMRQLPRAEIDREAYIGKRVRLCSPLGQLRQ